MYYEYHKTLNANISKANAEKTTLAFTYGIIVDMGVFFPPGCQQLVRCQIFEDENQRWPLNPDEYIAGDGGTVMIEKGYLLKDPQHEYSWRTWNVDETYAHTITLRAVVVPPEMSLLILENVAKTLEDFVQIYRDQWRL